MVSLPSLLDDDKPTEARARASCWPETSALTWPGEEHRSTGHSSVLPELPAQRDIKHSTRRTSQSGHQKNAVGVMVPKHIIGFYDSVSTWRICICSAPSPIRRQVPLVLSVQTPHLPPQHSRGILRGPHGLFTRCSCCLDFPEWGHQS